MRRILCALIAALALPVLAVQAGEEKKPEGQETVVLGTRSFWRVFVVLRPPLLGTAEDAEPDNDFTSRYDTRRGGVEAR